MRAILALVLTMLAGCGGAPDVDSIRGLVTAGQRAVGEPMTNSIGMIFVPIPAGEFEMGVGPPEKGQEDHLKSARPRRMVRISKPFYLGACEVTQQQFSAVMTSRPWDGKPLVTEGENYAASYISWDDATEFCKRLSDKEGVRYRLPTEAEWEYACRAGTTTAFSFGDDGSQLVEHAWFDRNAYADGEQYPHRVGQLQPNPWGLYDMHGNVWEWCADWYAPYDKQTTEPVDPTGPEKGWIRVWRGGGFADNAVNLLSASRLSYDRIDYRPEFVCGFRVVRGIE